MRRRAHLLGTRGVAALAGLLFGFACDRSAERPPNVVLIVLDTTRADHLPVYGYPEETTPNLSRLAEDSIVFERAYATSPWTLASHASLFTGLLPATHGATQEYLYLDDEIETLAELLSARGYATAAFTNNSWISRVTNLTQGFAEIAPMWREKGETGRAGLPHPTNVRVLEWLRERSPAQPFFLFVNYIEPHWPYDAPREYQDRFVDPRTPGSRRQRSNLPDTRWYAGRPSLSPRALRLRSALYDAELAYADAAAGELIEGLRALDLLGTSLLVVTADHGENLGERGHLGHSFTLYDSTLRIPLLIRTPGRAAAGTRRTDVVQLTDVFVTLASAAGAPPREARVTGRELLSGPTPSDAPIVGEYYTPQAYLARFPTDADVQAALAPFRRRLRSIQVGGDKLIWGSDGRHELYDLARDPGEELNRIELDPGTARQLEERLATLVERLERPVERRPNLLQIDEEMKANLRALGYMP